MNLSYEKQMTIAVAQTLIQKYGAVITPEQFSEILGIGVGGLRNKISNLDPDLPRFTKLKGKSVFMASDIAEWMVLNDLKFPK